MLMIGVIPLPALMNRSLSGRSSGRVKSPSTPPSETIVPGRPRRTRYGETLPSSTFLTVIEIRPSVAPRVGGQRVRPPVAHPLDVQPDPQVLPRPVARPAVAGLDQHGGGVSGLLADLLDLAPQLAGGPERVDQLEVVVDEQRRTQRAERLQHPALDRMNVWWGASLGHLLVSNIHPHQGF